MGTSFGINSYRKNISRPSQKEINSLLCRLIWRPDDHIFYNPQDSEILTLPPDNFTNGVIQSHVFHRRLIYNNSHLIAFDGSQKITTCNKLPSNSPAILGTHPVHIELIQVARLLAFPLHSSIIGT